MKKAWHRLVAVFGFLLATALVVGGVAAAIVIGAAVTFFGWVILVASAIVFGLVGIVSWCIRGS